MSAASEAAAKRTAIVEDMPRRTAHALHALLEASTAEGMPPTASEAMLYDEEALSPRATAAALTSAARSGYCFRAPDGCWWPQTKLYDLRRALEDRYLAETERDNPPA